MKRYILPLLLVSMSAFASSSLTPHYNLEKPRDGSTNWGVAIRDAFDKVDSQMYITATGLDDHVSDTVGAHLASAISSTPGSGICFSADDVQSFLNCLDANMGLVLTGGAVNLTGVQTITGAKTFSTKLTLTGGLQFPGFSTGILHTDVVGNVSTSLLVDADVSSSAAIALSKLASLTPSQAVVTTEAGVLSTVAVTPTELGHVAGVTSAIQEQIDSKQANGDYITALTGDVTASGPGSATATITDLAWSKVSKVGASPSDIGAASSAMLVAHMSDAENPHTVTKTQVGLGNVPNTDATNPANITQDETHRFVTDAEKTTWSGKQDALGYTPVAPTDIIPTTSGGTGVNAADANAVLNALLPSQTGNETKALITDGTNTSWGTVASSGGGTFYIDVVWNGSETEKVVDVSAYVTDANTAIWQVCDNANYFERMYLAIRALTATEIWIMAEPALPAGTYRLIGVK